jgi:serine/threonine protein kinase
VTDDILAGFQNDVLRFERLLGRGGMGAVYKGIQLSMNREVAIKVIAPHRVDNRKSIDRFLSEARTLGKLVHPHVIACHDVGEFVGPNGANVIYMLLEYVDGQSLGTMLKNAQLPIRDVLEYHRQVAEGLAAAHKLGIIHRDIKPDNIIVTTTGIAKLADFGLAKNEEDLGLTQDGAVIGTPYYIAPEVWNGKEAAESSDIYSFGCSLFHMLTGSLPYKAKGTLEIMKQHVSAPIPTIADFQGDLAFLQPIINHCLAKNPIYRFQSAQKLAHHLAQAVEKAAPSIHSGKRQAVEPRQARSSDRISERRIISERRRAATRSRGAPVEKIVLGFLALAAVIGFAVLLNSTNAKPPPQKGIAASAPAMARMPSPAQPAPELPDGSGNPSLAVGEHDDAVVAAIEAPSQAGMVDPPATDLVPPDEPIAVTMEPASSDPAPAAPVQATTTSPAPELPPLVRLTTPAEGEVFPLRATITLTAEVRDKISKIEFFQGTRLLRTDAAGPYTCTLSKATAGSYTFTARSVDATGARTTSTPVTVVVLQGSGLTGHYFPNLDLTGSPLTRIDPVIDFEWGVNPPDKSMPADFSARWTGYVLPQHSQSYTFHVNSDDGARLWVDGALLIDQWSVHPPTEYSGSMDLKAGVKYPIRLEFFDHDRGAAAQLRWSSANTPKEIIPSTRLSPANSGAAAAPTIPKRGSDVRPAGPGPRSILLVDFGKDSAHNVFGLDGWSTVIKDKYTDYQDLGPGGTCIVDGLNGGYDHQGVTGTQRNFLAGEVIQVAWYNNSASAVTISPLISFSVRNRLFDWDSAIQPGVYPMTAVTIPTLGSATSAYEFTPESAGAYSVVNVNAHFDQNRAIVADKIELIPLASSAPVPAPGKIKVPAQTRGLIGYWRFDENTGTRAHDSTDIHQDATLLDGAVWTKGRSGAAVSLDGVNAHVDLDTAAGLPQGGTGKPFSVCYWLYSNPTGSGNQMGVARWDEIGKNHDWLLGATPQKGIGFFIKTPRENGTVVWAALSSPAFPADSWHHIAGVYAGETNLAVYCDGELVARGKEHSKSASNASCRAVTIGAGQKGAARHHHTDGRVDEVRIYDRALSENDIREIILAK